MLQETIDIFNNLNNEKTELNTELNRIVSFLERPADNRDKQRAINQGKIFVKFAGTACYLPSGIFTGALNSRKAEINKRLMDIETELNTL